MKIETDIKRIEDLTRHGDDDDRRYRSLLNACDLTAEEIDTIAQRHYREISGRIDCRACGNCCKVFRPLLKARDVGRLAKRLRMPREDFIEKYLVGYENGKVHAYKITPCPFLVDNACTVYSDRPDACRSYPGLHRKGFVSRLGLALASCSICPIVYNVYERVKGEIRARCSTTSESV